MAIGTPTNVGTGFAANTATTVTITGVTAAVGDLLIVFGGNDGDTAGITSVSDSAGNTYTADVANVIGGDGAGSDQGVGRVFSSVLTSALSAGTITVTKGGSGSWDKFAAAIKVTGSWDSTRVDKTSVGRATTGASWSSGATASTTVADELVMGFAFLNNGNSGTAVSSTPGTGFTEIHDNDTGNFITYTTEYKIVAATGTQTATGTWAGLTNRPWGAIVVTYKEASSGSVKTLTGTANLAFTESASLVRTRAVSATDNIAFTESATLVRTRALSPSDTITFTESATVTTGSIQSLTGSVAMAFAETASLVVTRAIAAATSLSFTETAALAVTRVLSAATNITFTEAATLTKTSAGVAYRMVAGVVPGIFKLLRRR